MSDVELDPEADSTRARAAITEDLTTVETTKKTLKVSDSGTDAIPSKKAVDLSIGKGDGCSLNTKVCERREDRFHVLSV